MTKQPRILITQNSSDFNKVYSVTDLNKIVGIKKITDVIKEHQIEEYLKNGWSVDMTSKTSFNTYYATMEAPEYATYKTRYLSKELKKI